MVEDFGSFIARHGYNYLRDRPWQGRKGKPRKERIALKELQQQIDELKKQLDTLLKK